MGCEGGIYRLGRAVMKRGQRDAGWIGLIANGGGNSLGESISIAMMSQLI
jgi:hypothetical protein